MNYVHTLKKYWFIPISLVIATMVLSLVVSFVQTPKYSSTVKLLVIQRQGTSQDAYSAARSAETIASVLSRMVYTTSFFDQVANSQFKLEGTFSESPVEKKKEWEKMVSAKALSDGSLEIDVLSPNKDLAEGYALAIAHVLVNHGKDYHGGDNQVEIRMVDQPFTSDLPSSPNVLQNGIFGMVSGGIFSVAILLFLAFRDDENPLSFAQYNSTDLVSDENELPVKRNSVDSFHKNNKLEREEEIDIAFSEPEQQLQSEDIAPVENIDQEQADNWLNTKTFNAQA